MSQILAHDVRELDLGPSRWCFAAECPDVDRISNPTKKNREIRLLKPVAWAASLTKTEHACSHGREEPDIPQLTTRDLSRSMMRTGDRVG